MARSNGPLTPSGAGRTPRPDPQNWAQGTPPRPAARPAQPQQSAYPQQPAYPQQTSAAFAPQSAGAAYQQAAYGAAPQASPQAANPDPRYASRVQANEPRTAPPQARPAASNPGNSSAFNTFVSQNTATPAAAAPQSYPAQSQHASAAAYGAADHGQAADGFGQWSHASPTADARGFDYGSFGAAAPNGAAGYAHAGYADPASGYGQEPSFGSGQADQAAYGEHDGWDHGDEYGHEPSLDEGYGQDQVGALEQSYAEDDYEMEPRRRRKLPLIAAAVAGALLCGGGLAYGYKTFLGPVPGGDTPLIKTSSIPSKVKPEDPGGRKFAHSEPSIMGGSSKVMGGPLGDGAEGSGPSDSARKVQTVEVRPDGSVVTSGSDAQSGGTSAAPSHAAASASAMDFPSAGETGAAAPASTAAPEVIAKAEPTPPAAPPAARDEVATEAPPPVSEPKKVQAKKVAAVAAPTAPIGPAPTGAGWVAVLASVPVSSNSQMDSLKQFADLQQKYSDVLGDKTPSVQEANLGEKGRYHRLVVGPPASRDSASSICGSLKSAGFSGCWVAQY